MQKQSLYYTGGKEESLTPQQVAEMMPLVAQYYEDHGLNLIEELLKNDERLRRLPELV